MKISAITAQNSAVPSFNGQWNERRVGHFFSGRYYTECTYKPDKDESLESIAYAWKSKTGELPSQWIRTNNIYNQQGEKRYHLADNFYMPLNLIKASLEIERERNKYYGQEEISVAELARVSKQDGDVKAEKEYEILLKEIANRKLGAKNRTLMKEFLNNYKEHFGDDIYNVYY